MRHFQCIPCARPTRRGHYTEPANSAGPAETYRVIEGIAKVPRAEDRQLTIGGESHPLAPGHFDCDLCGKPIEPGDRGVCITAWQSRRQLEPPAWEHDYIVIPEQEPLEH